MGDFEVVHRPAVFLDELVLVQRVRVQMTTAPDECSHAAESPGAATDRMVSYFFLKTSITIVIVSRHLATTPSL